MDESPDVTYGRLLEAVNLSSYSFERAMSELTWLLDGDRWKRVGDGFIDVNAFLRTLDLSSFNFGDNRAALHQRIKELQPMAAERAIAHVTGAPKSSVHDDLARDRAIEDASDTQQDDDSARNRATNEAEPERQPPTQEELEAGSARIAAAAFRANMDKQLSRVSDLTRKFLPERVVEVNATYDPGLYKRIKITLDTLRQWIDAIEEGVEASQKIRRVK